MINRKQLSNSYFLSKLCQKGIGGADVNFQGFHYVLCIAKHQNLTKAAQELYISQPTLSKYLQKLEGELNGKLFSRSGNTYIPTYLGRRYLEYARKVLAVNQDWEKELMDLHACSEGELNIAFPLMRSSCMAAKIMGVFYKEYPGVRVNFMEETYAIQEKLLLNDQLDFAIFNESRPHPKLAYETLLKEEILLVMRPDHPLAAKGQNRKNMRYPWMDLREMAHENFILHFPEQTTGQIALKLFEKYGIQPPVPVRTRNTEACVQMCMQGIGVCLIPETYIRSMYFPEQPLCFGVEESGVFSTLTIAYRKGAYLPGYARDFIRIAQENV